MLHYRIKKSVLLGIFISLTLSGERLAGQIPTNFQMPTKGICAHRGASVSHPENTLAAFKEAIRLGAHMIELDLALSKDDAIVVLHDSTLDRTTDGKGLVSDWSLKELKTLDAGSFKATRFKGERIPTFQEVLEIMPENIWLNVHLKGGTELAIAATKVIVEEQRLHQCFLACGTKAAEAAQKTDLRIKICNMEKQGNNLQYVRESINAGAEFIQLFGGMSVDPVLTKLARENNLIVNFCCTNDEAALKSLFESGVEFPLVDDLAKMIKIAVDDGINLNQPIYRARNLPSQIATPISLLTKRIALEQGMATQGLAISDQHYFTSNAGSIVRYTKQWKFVEEKKIRLPGVNHIGAIDYHNGYLWAGFLNGPENGQYDAANNKAIVAKINAKTLEVSMSWDLTSKLNWIDPVCFDGRHLWVGDLSDLGIHRYRFDGEEILHTGTLRYPKEMHFSQGIRIKNNHLYSIHTFGSMDGLFEFLLPAELNESPVTPTRVWRIPELFTHTEGFAFVPGNDLEIWHAQYRYVDKIKLKD